MCFYLEEIGQKPTKAEEPIKCWKIIIRMLDKADVVYPPYYTEKAGYQVGELVSSLLANGAEDVDLTIEEGLHSYESWEIAREHFDMINATCGHKGSCEIVPFIIPKGAMYFYNKYRGEYVSDKIVRSV
jgi:hypothetical protein